MNINNIAISGTVLDSRKRRQLTAMKGNYTFSGRDIMNSLTDGGRGIRELVRSSDHRRYNSTRALRHCTRSSENDEQCHALPSNLSSALAFYEILRIFLLTPKNSRSSSEPGLVSFGQGFFTSSPLQPVNRRKQEASPFMRLIAHRNQGSHFPRTSDV